MSAKCKLNLDDELNTISLYDVGVPLKTIGKIYSVSDFIIWKTLKKYRRLGMVNIRTKSETVIKTVSKFHSNPSGEHKKKVQGWFKKFGRDGLIDILTVILLTDGYGSYKYKTISVYSTDKTILNIFVDILKHLGLNARKKVDKRTLVSCIFARENKVKEIFDEITMRTPTTKHQPARGKQNWSDYLNEKHQPSLSFLYKRPIELRQLAFRIAVSLEGCAILHKIRGIADRPSIHLTCFHHVLINEWKELAKSIGIKMYRNENSLISISLDSIINFLKIGSFLDGVSASSKSRYFESIEKNKILLGMLEYYRQQKEKYNLNKSKKFECIRQIIKNGQFKHAEVYIDYLTKVYKGYHGILTEEGILKELGYGPRKIKDVMQKLGFSTSRTYPILKKLVQNRSIVKERHGIYRRFL